MKKKYYDYAIGLPVDKRGDLRTAVVDLDYYFDLDHPLTDQSLFSDWNLGGVKYEFYATFTSPFLYESFLCQLSVNLNCAIVIFMSGERMPEKDKFDWNMKIIDNGDKLITVDLNAVLQRAAIELLKTQRGYSPLS